MHEREAKKVRRDVIEQIVRKNMESDAFIDSAESIQREISEEVGVEVKI